MNKKTKISAGLGAGLLEQLGDTSESNFHSCEKVIELLKPKKTTTHE